MSAFPKDSVAKLVCLVKMKTEIEFYLCNTLIFFSLIKKICSFPLSILTIFYMNGTNSLFLQQPGIDKVKHYSALMHREEALFPVSFSRQYVLLGGFTRVLCFSGN